MAYDNTEQGVLFRNKKHEKGDKRPTHTGSLNHKGVDYWLACWPDEEADGTLDVKASPKDETSQEETTYFKLAPHKGGSKDPNYKGEFNGTRLACWINVMERDTKNLSKGDKYLSIKLGGGQQRQQSQSQEPAADVDEDDIPF